MTFSSNELEVGFLGRFRLLWTRLCTSLLDKIFDRYLMKQNYGLVLSSVYSLSNDLNLNHNNCKVFYSITNQPLHLFEFEHFKNFTNHVNMTVWLDWTNLWTAISNNSPDSPLGKSGLIVKMYLNINWTKIILVSQFDRFDQLL